MRRLLIFVVIFTVSKSDNVIRTGLCMWQNGVNDVNVKKLMPLVGKSYQCSFETYKYTINICDTAAGEAHFNAVIQTDTDKKTHKVGDMRSADLFGGTDWLMLWFYDGEPYSSHCGGQNRSAVVMLTCDSWAGTGSALALEENTDKAPGKCIYLFEIKTSLVCPKKGLSAGSIFIIIFCVVVAVYLIIGFFYQRLVNNARGWEQIPNYNFWVNFGALQSDGCNFLCRCDDSQQSKEYRNIDEAIASSNQITPRLEEPDERLLNM